MAKFPDNLLIARVDVTQPYGQDLYQKAIATYKVPDDRLGVPALIVGEHFLVGDQEIPQQFPALIAAGLASGGVEWPDLPGLDTFTGETGGSVPAQPQPVDDSTLGRMLAKFQRDIPGNTLAVVVLLGMVFSLVYVAYQYVMGNPGRSWPGWVIPTLAVIGMLVAFYLTFVETTNAEAICGPIGDCNSVQKSTYAMLFGVLPIGVLGLLGYLAILILWLVQRFSYEKWRRLAWQGIWAFSIFGVMFSIYLTFLEPFVIGATCIWCISSAIIMTLIMWAARPQAIPGSGMSDAPQTA